MRRSIVLSLIAAAAATTMFAQEPVKTESRFFDVSALLARPLGAAQVEWQGPIYRAFRQNRGSGESEGEGAGEEMSVEWLTNTIRLVGGTSWEEEGRSISLVGGGRILLVRQTPEMLDAVGAAVAELSAANATEIAVEVLVVEAGHAAVAGFIGAGGVMGAQSFEALRGGKDQGMRVVGSISGTIADGRAMRLDQVRAVTVCGDVDVEVAQSAQISDPRLQLLEIGARLHVAATLLDDGRIALAIGGQIADDLKIETFTSGAPQVGKMQLPSVNVGLIRAAGAVASGEALIVGGIGGEGQSRRFLAIRADIRGRKTAGAAVSESVRVYPIGHLTGSSRFLPPLSMGISSGDHGGGEDVGNRPFDGLWYEDSSAAISPDQLVDMIRNLVTPSAWEEDPKLQLNYEARRLIVAGGQAQHQGIKALLGKLSAMRHRYVNVGVTVVATPRSALATLRSGGNDQWIRQVVRAPESSRRFTASVAVQMNAPAGLAVGRETAYVDDYNVEIAQAATIADPAIETVFGGLSLRLLAQPSGKEGRTSLAFEVVMTTMAPEIGTFQTGTVDSGRMQQPAVERFQNTGITAIDDKEYGLLAEFSSAAAPDEVLLVVAQVQPLGSGK